MLEEGICDHRHERNDGEGLARMVSRRDLDKILSRQPAGDEGRRPLRTLAATIKARWICEQASPTGWKERTRSRSLRGTILARPSPSCAHDDDRICLPPALPPFNSKAGKKELTGHRPSPLYQPCATPSSNSSLDHHRSDVRIAENGFATSSGVSEFAKVVLVSLPRLRTAVTRWCHAMFSDALRGMKRA